mgnify:CR=1 FL=1
MATPKKEPLPISMWNTNKVAKACECSKTFSNTYTDGKTEWLHCDICKKTWELVFKAGRKVELREI